LRYDLCREAKDELAKIESYRIKLIARNKNLREQAESALQRETITGFPGISP